MNSPIYEAAQSLKKSSASLDALAHGIKRYIVDHANSLPEKHHPKSIIESRFTPAEEAFEKGLMSCGAMANIGAAMLRHVGFKVRLVHGEWEGSVDHAWISIYDETSGSWKEYDLTTFDEKMRPGHKKKKEVDSWEEIRDELVKDHETLKERRIAKGIHRGQKAS